VVSCGLLHESCAVLCAIASRALSFVPKEQHSVLSARGYELRTSLYACDIHQC
jgi:hypothetical protein